MRTYNYIYIDDVTSTANDLVKGFNKEKLNIEVIQNKANWKDQIDYIIQNRDNIQGLILDLKLNDKTTADGLLADFMGSSIATEIRSRQSSNEINFFPIILISANENIKKIFDFQESAIFDLIIDKGDITSDSFQSIEGRLCGLANAYCVLNILLGSTKIFNEETIKHLINFDISNIDDRFISAFDFILKKRKPDAIIKFILNNLILHQGLLINEDVLAARLGIDKNESSNWNAVVDYFKACRYKGILCEGWDRWWMPLIDDIWNNISNEAPYLQMLTAKERVDILTKKTGIENIKVATKLPKADSTRFWTVCQAYNKPLDPADGLMIIGQENLSPWLEPLYISIDGALKRKNHKNWLDIEKFEKSRLEPYKRYKQHEQRKQ